MKQINMFSGELSEDDNKYTKKVEAPIYEPKNKKPHIFELCDKYKTHRLIREIESSNIELEEKSFLILIITNLFYFFKKLSINSCSIF